MQELQEFVYKFASNVSTPLALAGITVALFCRVILAVINGNLLSQADPTESAKIIKRVFTFFFILSLVAALLGFLGWIYSRAVVEQRRVTATESFSHLVTTMRTETERLMIEYPADYQKLIAKGRTPEEAKQDIAATFRHRIDTTVSGDKLGSQMRLGFPEYPWKHFFTEGKDHFRDFLNAVHNAASADQSSLNQHKVAEMRNKIAEMRKDYMHHLEQRLAELREKCGS